MDEDLLRCTIDVKRFVQRTILGQRKKPRRGDTGQGAAGALLSGADFQVSSGRHGTAGCLAASPLLKAS